jgi:hypothetical protein
MGRPVKPAPDHPWKRDQRTYARLKKTAAYQKQKAHLPVVPYSEWYARRGIEVSDMIRQEEP